MSSKPIDSQMLHEMQAPEGFDLGTFRWVPYPLVAKTASSSVMLPTTSVEGFIKSIPSVARRQALTNLARRMVFASVEKAAMIWTINGNMMRAGVGPMIMDLMDRNMVTGLCFDGDAARFDSEMGLFGRALSLDQHNEATAGLWRELGVLWAEAAERGRERRFGFGFTLGELISRGQDRNAEKSLLAEAARRRIPATVHFSPGLVGPELYPEMSPADFGEACWIDFSLLMKMALSLNDGVWVQEGDFHPFGKLLCRLFALLKHMEAAPERMSCVFMGMHPERCAPKELQDALVLNQHPNRTVHLVPGPVEFSMPLLRAFLLKECGMAHKFRDL